MKGAQLGATEAALNWLGYIIHHAPGLALLVMPSLDMARRNTRTRLDPMIEATQVLREVIATLRSKDAYNSAFTKSFPGGVLVMTGANSAAALRSTPARYLALDEVDGFPPDCGGEGDPVALAIARTVTFAGRRKVRLTSTPTVAGVSRIEKAYLEGDQRHYHVPRLHCGQLAPIEWKNIRWPEGKRAEVSLVCDKCGGIMQEHDKPRLLAEARWQAMAEGDGRTASFHLSALYSPFLTWAEVTIEHGAARNDPPRMQAWQNLMLGEPYEDVAAQPIAVGKSSGRNLTPCCVSACHIKAASNCGFVLSASTAAAIIPLPYTTSSLTSRRAAYGPARAPHARACRRGRAGRYVLVRTALHRSISLESTTSRTLSWRDCASKSWAQGFVISRLAAGGRTTPASPARGPCVNTTQRATRL